jgi:GTP-binding protein Era
MHRPDAQVVFVDTPGLHKPVTPLGERVNATALDAINDVEVVCFIVDATKKFGRGDQWVADRIDIEKAFVIVNKIDLATPQQVLEQLAAVSALNAEAYFPVSAKSGEGVEELASALLEKMPEGPAYYPEDMSSDMPEPQWIAELVREQLLEELRDELPYSIATRVTEWELPRIRVEILVERESQKGMVIGRGGELLKKVGQRARAQMPPGTYLDLHVTVEKDWQHRPDQLERLGY